MELSPVTTFELATMPPLPKLLPINLPTEPPAAFPALCQAIVAALRDPIYAPTLDDILEELTNIDIKPTQHFGPSGLRSGCHGPICSTWRSDRIREARRLKMLALNDPSGHNIGTRKPVNAARFRATTVASVLFILWKRRKPPTSLIESCMIDQVQIPSRPEWDEVLAKWHRNNAQKANTSSQNDQISA